MRNHHVRSSAEAVFSSRPLFDDRSREKYENSGSLNELSFDHMPPYRVDTRNSPFVGSSGRGNAPLHSQSAHFDTSGKKQTGKVRNAEVNSNSEQTSVAFSQLFEHFDVAMHQLPHFHQLRDSTVQSFVSPRHQLCLAPAAACAITGGSTAKMAASLPRIESAENVDKSATADQYSQKAKSRYMWIDSMKQWIEMDSNFVPYISFIHKMQLSEPDIAHLQNGGKLEHDSAKTSTLPFSSSKDSLHSQRRPAAARELAKSETRFLKDDVADDMRQKATLASARLVQNDRNLLTPAQRGSARLDDQSAPAPSRRSTKTYENGFALDNEPAHVGRSASESSRATQRDKSKSTSTAAGTAADALVDGPNASAKKHSAGKKQFADARLPADDSCKKVTDRRIVKDSSKLKNKQENTSGRNFIGRQHQLRENLLDQASCHTLPTSKLRKENSSGANAEKSFISPRRPDGDGSFENSSKSDLHRKASDLRSSSRVDSSTQRADSSAKRADSSTKRADSSAKRADSSTKRADSSAQEGDASELGAMSTLSEEGLSRSRSSSSRFGFSRTNEPTIEADFLVTDSEKSDMGKQSRCESDSSYKRVGSEKQKRKDEQHTFTLLLPKVKSSSSKKKSAKPQLDKSYAEELRRQEAAELIKQKFKKVLENESSKLKFPIAGLPEEPIYDDYGWLAKYCIFNSGVLEMYRRAFDAVDERGRGWISPMECMMALKGVNSHLSNSEEKYLFRITELLGRRNRLGIDFRLFSVIAGLSQRLAALDNWMRSLIDKTDLAGLEMKLSVCLKLWEFTADEMTKKLPLEKLYVELKAGGVSPQHEQEVRHRLGWMKALDILDFLTYMPLFIMIHQSVIDNPLSDLRNK